MLGKYPPHDVFIDVDAKGSGDFLRDSGSAEPGIAALHLQDNLDELWRWALGPGLLLLLEE